MSFRCRASSGPNCSAVRHCSKTLVKLATTLIRWNGKQDMSWREAIAAKIGPGTLSGITLADWLRLLADNRFAVDSPYWPRAAVITWSALFNSLFGGYERLRCERAIAETEPL